MTFKLPSSDGRRRPDHAERCYRLHSFRGVVLRLAGEINEYGDEEMLARLEAASDADIAALNAAYLKRRAAVDAAGSVGPAAIYGRRDR